MLVAFSQTFQLSKPWRKKKIFKHDINKIITKKTLHIYKGHSINKRDLLVGNPPVFFCHKYKLCIVWNWFRAKIILISQNICFEAIQNGGKLNSASTLNISVHSIFLWLYTRIWFVYKEAHFNQKYLQMGQIQVHHEHKSKWIHEVEKHRLSSKEKVPHEPNATQSQFLSRV